MTCPKASTSNLTQRLVRPRGVWALAREPTGGGLCSGRRWAATGWGNRGSSGARICPCGSSKGHLGNRKCHLDASKYIYHHCGQISHSTCTYPHKGTVTSTDMFLACIEHKLDRLVEHAILTKYFDIILQHTSYLTPFF